MGCIKSPYTAISFRNHTALLLQGGNNLKRELETITKTHTMVMWKHTRAHKAKGKANLIPKEQYQ